MGITAKTDEYKAIITDRWHTPGHKGVLWADDITEIEGDYFPAQLITEAEKNAAIVYGTKKLRFLTGGSSMGVKAAILAAGGDIIAGSDSHRSVFEGARLAKVNVFTIENETSDGLPLPLSAGKIINAINLYPSAKAVVITSPDYYGRVCAEDVTDAVKSRGLLLIADSAHGAHFPFRPDLFPQSFSSVADFCNLSAHKTLCALTMGAYLCVNNEAYFDKIDEELKCLGTTSPLYPLLASLERAVMTGALCRHTYDNIKQYVHNLSKNVKLRDSDDFTRIVVDASQFNLTGAQLHDKLFFQGIAAEKFTERHVVFIATPFDDEAKFIRLADGIKNAANKGNG